MILFQGRHRQVEDGQGQEGYPGQEGQGAC